MGIVSEQSVLENFIKTHSKLLEDVFVHYVFRCWFLCLEIWCGLCHDHWSLLCKHCSPIISDWLTEKLSSLYLGERTQGGWTFILSHVSGKDHKMDRRGRGRTWPWGLTWWSRSSPGRNNMASNSEVARLAQSDTEDEYLPSYSALQLTKCNRSVSWFGSYSGHGEKTKPLIKNKMD